MRNITPAVVLVLWLAGLASAQAQTTDRAAAPTATQTILDMIGSVEKSITGVATEMPEDKYGFAPTQGAFRGVRNFAAQIKHAASVHNLIAASLLGDPITADMSDERGPDAVKTKAEVLKYLADSFAYLRKAAATVDEKNAFAPIKGVFGSAPQTRIGLIVVAVSHTSNHYGQVVEYLRMNGLVPPTSQ
jgi:DinB superfamily